MNESKTPSAAAHFVGSVPELYDRYLGPLLFDGYASDLANRTYAPDDGRILEVAAGTGILTEKLRSKLPSGATLTATDLNPPMLAIAERRLARATLTNGVTFREVDATSLPFDGNAFDAVVCQFGVMFFPDKPRAAMETFRVLRPGGQWLFNVWGSWSENPFARLVHETVATFFPDDPPGFYKVPFGFHDADALRALAIDAGFAEPEIVTLDRILEAPSAADAAIGLIRGNPIIAAIQERGPIEADAVVSAVARRLAGKFGDHPLRLPSRVRVVNARRPS